MATAVRQPDLRPAETNRAAGARAAFVPGLDGLRGVAVILVILYHFAPRVAPAGFLGVDVFFVLSGFLITRLLLVEAERTGGLRLGRFWTRRARRLVPALLLTILGTCLIALLTDLDGRFTGLARHARASLFYVVNWAFIREHASYFAAFETPSPLRHLWSLAIEEQFYLLWPLVLVAVYRLTAGHRRQSLAIVGVVAAIGAVLSAVAMAAMFHDGADPSRVYYGTDTRVFGVLLGAVAAVVLLRRQASSPPGAPAFGSARWLAVGGAIALVAVVACSIRLDDRSSGLYRGGLFVLSAAVAVLVLALTVAPARGAAPLLSLRPLRAVGVVSYGLYLYHWPVFLYVSERTTGRSGLALFVMRGAITGVLAWLSFTLVERPVRERRLAVPGRVELGAAAGIVAVILALTTALPTATSLPTTLPAPPTTAAGDPAGAPAGAPAPAGTGAPTPSAGGPAAADDLRILAAGDSVGFTFAYYWPLAATPGVAIDGTAALGCRLQDGVILAGGHESLPTDGCGDWRTAWPAKLAAFRPDLVVLFATEWEVYDSRVDGEDIAFGSPESDARVEQYLDDLRQMATAAGAKLVLVTSPPITAPDQPAGSPRHRGEEWRVEHLNELYRAAAAGHPDEVAVLAMEDVVCTDQPCTTGLPAGEVFDDGLHFDREGMERVAPAVLPELRAIAGT